MVMDDSDDPVVRALREDPLPDRSYSPGRFADRVRGGNPGRPQGSQPTARRTGARGATLRGLAALAVVIVVVAGLAVFLGQRNPIAPGASPSAVPSRTPGAPASLGPTLKIGVSLPLSSLATDPANAIRDGVLLAIADANARHQVPGLTFEAEVLDHSSPGNDDLAKATADMRALVADPTVVGVVGPYQSYVAQGQIPIGNAGGLLQCSSSASSPDLTKGPLGQLLRVARPDLVAFLRLSPTDDDVAPGLADFATRTLHARSAFVVDDGAAYGVPLAGAFAARFQTDGGSVVGRQSTTPGTTDYASVLQIGAQLHPDVVLYGGVNAFDGNGSSGAGALRKQMAATALAGVPLLGGDGLKDLDRTGASLIDIAGPAAIGTYSADLVPAGYPGQSAFDSEFQAAYGRAPEPAAGPGYACAQVLIQAVATAAQRGAITRENVRAAGASTITTFSTILGEIRFDAAGDVTTPALSVDTVDMTLDGGKGGWVTAPATTSSP